MDALLFDHLEQLGIVRSVKANDRFVFSTDTVAEYLAADYLLGHIRTAQNWRDLLQSLRTAARGITSIREFLLAIRENITSNESSAKMPFPAAVMISDIDAVVSEGMTNSAQDIHPQSASAH